MTTPVEVNLTRTRRQRLTDLIRTYIDIILGTIGAAMIIAAITVLFGWVIALLAAGVALVGVAMVVPEWD